MKNRDAELKDARQLDGFPIPKGAWLYEKIDYINYDIDLCVRSGGLQSFPERGSTIFF